MSAAVDAEELLERLLDSGVVTTLDGSDELALSEVFKRRIETEREELLGADEPLLEAVTNVVGHAGRAERLVEDRTAAREFLAKFRALNEFGGDVLSNEEVSRTLVVLDRFERALPPESGSPDAFLPVHGDQLKPLLASTHLAVVYVWRADSSACETMRANLDDVFATPPSDVLALSVYGPDWEDLLETYYDVKSAPTTLFVVDGRVDSRYVGPHDAVLVEREVEVIRSL